MSKFDYIKRRPVKCPGCGKLLTEFQSKSGYGDRSTITPRQLIKDAKSVWRQRGRGGPEVNYYAFCIGCHGKLTFTCDCSALRKKWKTKFRTWEEYQQELAKKYRSWYNEDS